MLVTPVDREIPFSLGVLLLCKILLLKPSQDPSRKLSLFVSVVRKANNSLSVGAVKLNDNIPLVKIQETVFVQQLGNGIGRGISVTDFSKEFGGCSFPLPSAFHKL